MTDLWIENVEVDVSADELKAFLVKYGFPPFDSLERIEGTGAHPGVVLGFDHVDPQILRALQPRINKLFWKNRTIEVQVMPEHDL